MDEQEAGEVVAVLEGLVRALPEVLRVLYPSVSIIVS